MLWTLLNLKEGTVAMCSQCTQNVLKMCSQCAGMYIYIAKRLKQILHGSSPPQLPQGPASPMPPEDIRCCNTLFMSPGLVHLIARTGPCGHRKNVPAMSQLFSQFLTYGASWSWDVAATGNCLASSYKICQTFSTGMLLYLSTANIGAWLHSLFQPIAYPT